MLTQPHFKLLLDKETCSFDETVQFVGDCKHLQCWWPVCCGSFWSLPCCQLSCTSSCTQVHTCSSWIADSTSNTLLRRCRSFRDADQCVDSDLRMLCHMQVGAVRTASLLHCLQGCGCSTPSNKCCPLTQSNVQSRRTPSSMSSSIDAC